MLTEQYVLSLLDVFVKSKQSLNFQDDCALLDVGQQYLAITKDVITQEHHFFRGENPRNIAYRLFSSNLSDILAMGAVPKFALCGAVLPSYLDKDFVDSFTEHLAEIMQKHHTYLIGGDSVVVNSSAYHCDAGGNLGCGKDNATGNGNAIGISKGSDTASGISNSDGDGGGEKVKATSKTNRADGFIVPITFSFTLIGYVDKGKELLTSQAKIGDDIYVTGTLGNAYAGYQILQGKITDNLFTKTEREYLINYFKAPSAPFANFAFAQKLYQYVDCATDISDGLASEVKILSKASNIPQENFKININQAPISKAVRKLIEHNANAGGNATKQSEASKQIKAREAKQRAINFGDDYEILFTSSPLNQRKLQEIATKENITITKIGCIM